VTSEEFFQVELFGVTEDAHDRERFARRRSVSLFGLAICVPTAEDVVINKLRWWKAAGRRKDFDDARNVVAVQKASIDHAYLVTWCSRLEIVDELDKLW
jgi:hypothetical protein